MWSSDFISELRGPLLKSRTSIPWQQLHVVGGKQFPRWSVRLSVCLRSVSAGLYCVNGWLSLNSFCYFHWVIFVNHTLAQFGFFQAAAKLLTFLALLTLFPVGSVRHQIHFLSPFPVFPWFSSDRPMVHGSQRLDSLPGGQYG